MSRLVIIGGGEHARVVAETAVEAGWELAGYTDRIAPAVADEADVAAGASADGTGRVALGLPYLGTDEDLLTRLAADEPDARPLAVLGFGAPASGRRRTVEALGSTVRWATVVHPGAWVSPSAVLGAGTVVLARAVVNTGARTGVHTIVNSGAIVEHDVRVGDFTHVAPGAVIGGGTTIGADAFIGLGAAVRDHVTVGDGALVAMGAVVTADVGPGALARGVPARSTRGADRG